MLDVSLDLSCHLTLIGLSNLAAGSEEKHVCTACITSSFELNLHSRSLFFKVRNNQKRRVGRMGSNTNIIRLEVLCDDSGDMRPHTVVMGIVAILQLRSLPIDVVSKSFQNIMAVLGIHLHLRRHLVL